MISFDTAWDDLQEPDGSFALNLQNEPPVGGFFVPLVDAEESVPFSVMDKEMLVSYVERHSHEIDGNYVMGWHGGDMIFLDVVQWFATEQIALSFAEQRGLPAVIDITTGDVVSVH